MGIRSRIFLPPLAVALLLMALIHFYWSDVLLRHQRGEFLSHQHALLAILQEAIVEELVDGRRERLREILDRSLALNGTTWKYLELRDLNGTLLYPEKVRFPEEGAKRMRIRYTLFDGETAVGRLVLDADYGPPRDESLAVLGRFEVLALLLALLTLGVVAGLQHTTLVRPLRRLRQAAGAMAAGDFSSPLPPERSGAIGGLAAVLEEMRIRLAYSHRETERALQLSRANEERFRLLFEHIAEGIVAVGENGQITSVNPASLQLFGRSREELIGLHASRLMSEESWRSYCVFLFSFLSSAEEQEAGRIELEALRRDGSSLSVELTISVVQEKEQRLLIWIVRDVGLRKEAERAMEEARMAAEEAARTKSQFLATMSHEIRTPLNGMLGMMELLEDTPLQSRQRHYLETMLGSGRVLLTVINDILDFSRIESGLVELERIPFDLERLCGELLQLLAPQAAGSRLDLRLEYDPLLPAGWLGDPVRLRQVLLNLLSNAVKFTERGSVVMRLSPRPEGGVVVEVEDTGIGIPEEAMERLFDQFTQADASTTRRYGGTGLGLAICKHLVELMGGRVSVRSRVGEGSCFRIELPLEEAERPVGEERMPEPVVRLRGKVMVVDDNPVNRRLAEAMLEHLGVDVVVAEGGREALALLEGETVDLILMDCCMPHLDGVETTRLLQQRFEAEGTPPVVALTANVNGEQRRACQAVGMVGVLAKPFSLRELSELLARWLPVEERGELAEAGDCTISSQGLYDLSRVRHLAETMGDEFPLLSRTFSDALRTQLADLALRVAERDREGLRRLAHAIKSGAASMGATLLAGRSSALEEGAGMATWRSLERGVAVVEQVGRATLEALEGVVEEAVGRRAPGDRQAG